MPRLFQTTAALLLELALELFDFDLLFLDDSLRAEHLTAADFQVHLQPVAAVLQVEKLVLKLLVGLHELLVSDLQVLQFGGRVTVGDRLKLRAGEFIPIGGAVLGGLGEIGKVLVDGGLFQILFLHSRRPGLVLHLLFLAEKLLKELVLLNHIHIYVVSHSFVKI